MIYIGADHGGLKLKKFLVRYITTQLKLEVEDVGAHELVITDDLQDFAVPLAKKVAKNKANRGILICKGGQGMVMTANKVKGIRALLGFSIENTEWTVKDDHANVLCLGSEYVSSEHAAAMVKKFLQTDYDNDERFLRRLKKMAALEK